jgi:uncharacterized protein YdhG (YjbR/CyaY superfamily)
MAQVTNGSSEVDAYIDTQPRETQRALEELRSCIWEAAPGVSETMNYNIPAFALVSGGKRDKQIMIAGYPKHVGFYPGPDVIDAFADQLAAYKFAKGSIQFPLNKPIPKVLVVKMVKHKLSQLQKRAPIAKRPVAPDGPRRGPRSRDLEGLQVADAFAVTRQRLREIIGRGLDPLPDDDDPDDVA